MRSAAATKRITGKQADKFFPLSETYTKFRASKNKFLRLKLQSCGFNEIWSGNLADVHQLATDNDGAKSLLVLVDCLSRFLRVKPIDNKSANQTRAALRKMTREQKPKKVSADNGKKVKRELEKLCLERNTTVYSTHSEQKSRLAL